MSNKLLVLLAALLLASLVASGQGQQTSTGSQTDKADSLADLDFSLDDLAPPEKT